MALIIAAVLIMAGLVAAAVVVIGVPVVFGLMAHDVATSRQAPAATEESTASLETAERAKGRIVLERGIARAFVIVGGVFWGIAAFVGLYSYRETGTWWTLLAAFIPLVATLATLIVGWYFERFTAALLVLGSVGVVYWGVVNQFEVGGWMLAIVALIGPMLTASVLFWMARREQRALDVYLAARPELVPAMATPSGR